MDIPGHVNLQGGLALFVPLWLRILQQERGLQLCGNVCPRRGPLWVRALALAGVQIQKIRKGTLMNFKDLRNRMKNLGLISQKCREVTPYKYTRNGATKRARGSGEVAMTCLALARENNALEGMSLPSSAWEIYPEGTWDGNWPRTLAAVSAEDTGTFHFETILTQLKALSSLQVLFSPDCQ